MVLTSLYLPQKIMKGQKERKKFIHISSFDNFLNLFLAGSLILFQNVYLLKEVLY